MRLRYFSLWILSLLFAACLFSLFLPSYSYSANPLGYVDDVVRVREKIFRALQQWDVEEFKKLLDPDTRRLLDDAVLDPDSIIKGLGIPDIKAAQVLFRKDFEKQLSKIIQSSDYRVLGRAERLHFHEALEQFKEIRKYFTTPGRSPFHHPKIEKVFKLMVTNEDYLLKITRQNASEILEEAARRQGTHISEILKNPRVVQAGERILKDSEKAVLSQAFRLQYADGLKKLVKLTRQRNRWAMRRPKGEILKGQLEKLNKKIEGLEKALQRLLARVYYLENTRDVPKISFVQAFQNSRQRLLGIQPDIAQEYVIGSAKAGRFLGDAWVWEVNLVGKTLWATPKKTGLVLLGILGSSVTVVVAFSVLVPPSKSVVGDLLTMMAFRILWWQYKDYLEEANVHNEDNLSHDLTASCPICDPKEGEDFAEEWAKHGMNELLQKDNPKVEGNLNNFFLSMFYGNSAALSEPMARGRDMYIGILKSVIMFKTAYIANETLQQVILLRLGKKAESYEEKKMLLQDMNASILSNYWLVEFAFFHPIIEPNLGGITNQFLYHQVFQHYLHRQPQLIERRYKKISEFLEKMKKKEEAVIQKAIELGFEIDTVSAYDPHLQGRTKKQAFHLLENEKIGLVGKFLIEQEGERETNPMNSLDLLPRMNEIEGKVDEVFKTKRIHLPEFEITIDELFGRETKDTEMMRKRKIIEEMIEEVKQEQNKFLDEHLISAISNLNNGQMKLAQKMSRDFPDTLDEVDEVLDAGEVSYRQEVEEAELEYELKQKELLQKIQEGTVEDPAAAALELSDRHTEKLTQIFRRTVESGELAKDVVFKKISKVLETGNALSSEYRSFRKEYDKFVIINLEKLARLQDSVGGVGEKVTELMQFLGKELQTAQLERAEIKAKLSEIQNEITQNIASSIEEGNAQNAAEFEEVKTLLEEILELMKKEEKAQ